MRAPRGAIQPGGDERTPPPVCRSRPVKLGAAEPWRRRGTWEQPRQRRDGPALPDGSGPASKARRWNESEPVAKPRNLSAGSNLVDMGRFAVHARRRRATPTSACIRRPRGHEESLRRTHGDAAGAQLATSLTDRSVVNVGTVLALPSPPPGGGQARRRLLAPGRGGVLVVVGAQESRAHGEGGQPGSESGSIWQEPTVNTAEPNACISTPRVLRSRTPEHRFDGSGGEPGAVRVARRVRRAGRGDGPGESPVPRPGSTLRGNAHVRFGGAVGETDRPKGRRCAPARSLLSGQGVVQRARVGQAPGGW